MANSRQGREPGPYCFESDEDGHFYVIPVARMAAWSAWLRSTDAENGVSPPWAYQVGGNPSLIQFPEFSSRHAQTAEQKS